MRLNYYIGLQNKKGIKVAHRDGLFQNIHAGKIERVITFVDLDARICIILSSVMRLHYINYHEN